MLLNFIGDIEGLDEGINILSKELGFSIALEGITINVEKTKIEKTNVEKTKIEKIEIAKKASVAYIKFTHKIHFYRALGLFVEALRDKDEFEIIEEPQFETNGAMFDISQGNAVVNVENLKKLIVKMAVMGLNMLMIYNEDNYEIETEPYFGYMRGRYSFSEMKQCDDFANMFGIEIIPCIQTLAHLIDALKWKCYDDIKDDDDTLFVGKEKSYEFLEKMIASATAPLRSKRIHLGMDEAWNLGQGKYLLENGYKKKFEIMSEHIERVLQITEKYGLNPIIWSDMYYKGGSKIDDYYDLNVEFSKDLIDSIPKSLSLVYWDYYHHTEEFYSDMIKNHQLLGCDIIFAGGIHTWTGFGANYGATFSSTNCALQACKKSGIKEVFATIWGDGGTESNVYSNLLGLQLFAEHGYSRELSTQKLENRFEFCTGAKYSDFMDIKLVDEVPGVPDGNFEDVNPSKYLMWQDVLAGMFDKNISGSNLSSHYGNLSRKFEDCKDRNEEYGFVFEFLQKVCHVLELKAEMGIWVTEAYKSNNRDRLRSLADTELPELIKRVSDLRLYHRSLWMKINKAFGWEIIDIRYGGLLARIDSAIERILCYLQGDIDAIEELDEERLYYEGVRTYGNTKGFVQFNVYTRMISASRLAMFFGF